jgi:uncharacterized protein
MRLVDGRLSVSPTDLANFLACRHKTALDREVAEGKRAKPTWKDALADVLRDRGDAHERRYVERLRTEGLNIVDLRDAPHEQRAARTHQAMHDGADVIVQASLGDERWSGYADVLRKVTAPSPALGAWSYEAHDTKLSRETRAGTILQLCTYSDLLGQIQGRPPEFFRVVTPIGTETYRFDDFGAYYRQAKARFLQFVDAEATPGTYPEPVDHCDVCRWTSACNKQRRADDHLRFVAGLGRHHQVELTGRGIAKLKAFAESPEPDWKPLRGAIDTMRGLHHQARLQEKARQNENAPPPHDLLPIDKEAGLGLLELPEPRPGDLFLDLEGDPFGRPVVTGAPGEGGREYLFGLGRVAEDGSFSYTSRWAFTDAEERDAFGAVMADIMSALDADPSIHIYHYAAYEPTTFKRLMGRYATREADLDRLLRGGRFVDLYSVVRHALRAGVERYSIKNMEPCYGFVRDVKLEDSGAARRTVELALETGELALIKPDTRAEVEGYNKDDCRSTLDLRNWLETLREAEIARGADIPRPPLEPDEASDDVKERQQRVNELRARLMEGVPTEPGARSSEEHARYLLAYLLDWHYVEDKVVWWEYFRLVKLTDEELLDEGAAVSGLELVERVGLVRNKRTGKPTGSVIDRYRYPPQEYEIRPGKKLHLREGKNFGEVVASDRTARTLDVKKGPGAAENHPTSAFMHERFNPKQLAESLFRFGVQVASKGIEGLPGATADLLLRRTARLKQGRLAPTEPIADYAAQIVHDLADTTLAIQGPPGSGKTYVGAQMILALVAKGERVGVTATSHKVIRNLFDAILKEAGKRKQEVRLGHKVGEGDDQQQDGVTAFTENDEALDALGNGAVNVLGGTAWLWAPADAGSAVDVLFVDEAGQMSLANALAVSQATKNLVLLGDPQQLEQPQKGSHPDGVDVSALDHVLEGHQTMPPERGLFLPVTWRLSPAICAFTSQLFYEGKLTSKPGLEHQRLTGTQRFDGSGLFVVEAEHDGCRSASDQEVEIVASIVEELLQPGAEWIDEKSVSRKLTAQDIRIVGPYNAHVNRLQERLPGVPVGTVDKFQGQEAPVVIYSMATSRPEDAPRGMEFLYSPNRLNVATSRAKCVCILVANPRLFEPDCHSPRQMLLANALARYRERSGGVA